MPGLPAYSHRRLRVSIQSLAERNGDGVCSGDASGPFRTARSSALLDWYVEMAKDMFCAVDYLETRHDVDGGHVPNDYRALVREALDWYDRYLGPVR